MASSAPEICSTPLSLLMRPPLIRAVARPVKVTLPLSPSCHPLTPLSTISSFSERMLTSCCGEVIMALQVIMPGLLAVRCTAMTLSASDEMYSRRYSTPLAV